MSTSNPIRTGKPSWLRRKLPSGPEYEKIRAMIGKGQLHTVCQEANCPNQFECFSARTATFLILGATCTRNCRFCNIDGGNPGPLDPDEPRRVAEASAGMNLRYVVVTSVTRDDLEDGGAGHFAATINALRETISGVRVEVLIPDFKGDRSALETVLEARPDVLNHNVETVRRLYSKVRPLTASVKVRYLRYASSFVTAEYRSTPHSSGFASLDLELFTKPSEMRCGSKWIIFFALSAW
jgi:lipoic acid synthetase